MSDRGVKPEYFLDGRVSPDDEVFDDAVSHGEIPETCRLGGPSIVVFRPTVERLKCRICDLCPYPHRHVCKGSPKPTDPLLKLGKSLDAGDVATNLAASEAATRRAKRDAARVVFDLGIAEHQRASKRGLKI